MYIKCQTYQIVNSTSEYVVEQVSTNISFFFKYLIKYIRDIVKILLNHIFFNNLYKYCINIAFH